MAPSLLMNGEQNSRIICVRNSLFEGVEGQGSNASVMGLMFDGKIAAKVENCTASECGGEWSNCGGDAFVTVPVEGEYVVNNSKVEKCWTERGKGGGMYLDCVSKEQKLAGFCFMDVVFKENRAMIGRDVSVRCNSISEQISEKQFQIDFREPGFERKNAVWGVEAKDGAEDVDLIPHVVVYRSEVIFVCGEMGEAGDMKTCGNRSSPCETLEYGLSHVIGTSYSQLLIDGWARVKRSGKAESVRVSSLSLEENGRVVLNESVEEEWGESAVMECWESVAVERVSIEVGNLFEWKGGAILSVRSGTLSVSLCEMCGALMNEAMSYSLIENKGGILHLTSSSIHSLMLSQPLIASCNQTFNDVGNVTMEKVSTSDVICARCGCQMRWRRVVIRDISGGGVVSLSEAEFEGNDVRMERMSLEQSEIVFDCRTKIELFSLTVEVVFFEKGSMIEALEIECESFACANSEICWLSVVLATFRNVSTNARQSSVMNLRSTESNNFGVEVCNNSCCYYSSVSVKGEMVGIWMMQNMKLENCIFSGDGSGEENKTKRMNFEKVKKEGLCRWNGSMVDIEKSNAEMRETTIRNSKGGGLWVSGGSARIENGKFENNNPSIEGYPSARRNVICEGNGELNVVSVKGGDGMLPNTSLWILDEGCELGGIAAERASPFFIPILEEVKNVSQPNGDVELMIAGKLLLPCDLSVKMSMKNGDEEEIVRKGIEEEGFVSENEIHTFISCSEWEKVREETEVSAWIVFGKGDSPSSTERFIVKNRSESVGKGDERIAEGGKEGKISWVLIVCIVIVVILLIVSIIFIVRWRKAKNEAKDLREIVNDNIRKDPKAFEMVTMEMSPEEQWRRAEREAEKKNEERIKKRVYEKSLGHSKSSEHLLSESGSTEYILGRDSDKIPQWMLEKVDEEEEEETRKRTPSPSISSTSTTDSDSTFVRSESLCPTTSSMSNLVDAMACSSPHEKLIVDLRDSLFMLLHGRNKTKEMAIGTLQEREQTAAQILFWVANLALHSFDEMENPLSSLSTLSPHIVLFSEHMVICIALHSDCSSSDDSDSSSISSSTVVTSASDDDDDEDSLPSSAFEDDEYNRKECLRWKAPELLMKKMGATKESVVFSIGMMLWECLTLQIPFGEYEGEVAGQKIVNGERPGMGEAEQSSYLELVKKCVSQDWRELGSLNELKREFIQRFPAGSLIMTMTDALCCYSADGNKREPSCGSGNGNGEGTEGSSRIVLLVQ
ncbi:uncharacterized protein MONOS_17764 [Monocercomonoides exilis]|uniref:uncharacterized protein n=1 Tax=Monocercomonoides exilis TaxID=2049356 RepID=UPI00355A4214|nr:hypothetical protein MONOS_17764 [Monocercomonoides exilis]